MKLKEKNGEPVAVYWAAGRLRLAPCRAAPAAPLAASAGRWSLPKPRIGKRPVRRFSADPTESIQSRNQKGEKKRKRNWKWEKTKTVELVHGSREREKRSFALNPPSSLSLPTSFVRPPTPVPLQSIQTHTRTQTAMLRENQRTNQKK